MAGKGVKRPVLEERYDKVSLKIRKIGWARLYNVKIVPSVPVVGQLNYLSHTVSDSAMITS